MGLDNGIVINSTEEKLRELIKDLPDSECLEIIERWNPAHGEYKFSVELFYWRKCWNVRQVIYDIMGFSHDDMYMYQIYVNDLEELLFYFETLLAENTNEFWQGDTYSRGSIWNWNEYKEQIQDQKELLEKLIEKLKADGCTDGETPGYEIVFYDSY